MEPKFTYPQEEAAVARERARVAALHRERAVEGAVSGLLVLGTLAFLGGGAYFFVRQARRAR